MMTKHISRAMGIRDSVVANPERKVYGLVYFLEGEGVASPLQFYLTDSAMVFVLQPGIATYAEYGCLTFEFPYEGNEAYFLKLYER